MMMGTDAATPATARVVVQKPKKPKTMVLLAAARGFALAAWGL